MKRTLVNIVAVLAAAIGIIAQAPQARADEYTDATMHDAALFCRWLDVDRSPEGIARAINEFEVQQVPRQVAIDTVTYALSVICPEHVDEWAYADLYYTQARYKI